MKKHFLVIALGAVFALCAGCGDKTATPTGVARLCQPVAKDQYLLLYDDAAQENSEGAADSFYLYDAGKDTFQALVSGEDLWYGPGYALSVTGSDILYQNDAGRLFSIMRDGKGELSEQTKSQENPYVISPNGTKYVIRQDGGVKVYDLRQDTLLAHAEGITDPLAMEWSEDNSRVAIVTNSGSAVTVWDTEKGGSFVYDALRDGHTPAQWVGINRAYVVGDGAVLLIDYLCESGSVFLFWDMAADRFLDQIEVAWDATILDISGD